MTKEEREVMRMALDFVASISPAFICEATHHKKNERHTANEPCPHVAKQKATYEAIKEALAQPEQKPVAWLHKFIEGGISIGLKPSDLKRHPERWEPLYTEPRPCSTCEALARTVMLDQTSHDTTPPQRKPLTDEECVRLAKTVAVNKHQIRAIEAAHGIGCETTLVKGEA